MDVGLKKWAIWFVKTASVQSSFGINPGLHFLGHFCNSSWFETDVVQTYLIRIRERHISILLTLLWTSIGVETFFVGDVDIGDPVDEVFVVVAIDAGFFVLIVDVFGVKLFITVVIFVVVIVVVVFVVVFVVVVDFVGFVCDAVGVVVDENGVVSCCDVVASELVGGSLRANI